MYTKMPCIDYATTGDEALAEFPFSQPEALLS